MTKEYHKVIPATYLVLQKENKILLLRRFNTGYEDGNYSFIAGHVNKGETFTQAMVREAKEEAGIDIKPEVLEVVHVMHRRSFEQERVDLFFATDEWNGSIKNKEPDKCDDLSWYSIENLPSNLIPCVRQAIECIKKGILYSEFDWN